MYVLPATYMSLEKNEKKFRQSCKYTVKNEIFFLVSFMAAQKFYCDLPVMLNGMDAMLANLHSEQAIISPSSVKLEHRCSASHERKQGVKKIIYVELDNISQ